MTNATLLPVVRWSATQQLMDTKAYTCIQRLERPGNVQMKQPLGDKVCETVCQKFIRRGNKRAWADTCTRLVFVFSARRLMEI